MESFQKRRKELDGRGELSQSQGKPRAYAAISLSSGSTDSCSTTEDMSCVDEVNIGEEIRNWLSMHGPKLFSLEVSKFLAKQNRGSKK